MSPAKPKASQLCGRGLVPAGQTRPSLGVQGKLVSCSVRSSGRNDTALALFGSLEVSCEY